jgi:carbohydrate-selective porin OprB
MNCTEKGEKIILAYFKTVLHHFKGGTQENHASHDSWAVGLDFNSGLPRY